MTMKKQLISLIASSLCLVACQSEMQVATQPQAPVQRFQQPVAPPPLSTPQHQAQMPSSVREEVTVIPADVQRSASSAAAPTQTSSSSETRVNIAENYNTLTLLAGLKLSASRADAEKLAQKYNLKIERFIEGIKTVVFLTQGQEVTQLIAQLKNEAVLDYVETDGVALQDPGRDSEVNEGFGTQDIEFVNDKLFDQQSNLRNTRIPEAWLHSEGDDVVVAVIDTGVDIDHIDLNDNMVPGFDAFSHRAGSEAGDVSRLNYFFDSYKHGTHVAGIIAAETDNGRGVAGVAPGAKIMPIKIFPDLSDWIQTFIEPASNSEETIVSVLSDGIIWAVDNGADIINLSLSVNDPSNTLERAVTYALENNVTVVVAAGNQGHLDNARNELAAIEGVIAVGSVDNNNELSFFSSTGDYVTLTAPGEEIVSTVPSFLGLKGYINMTGSSMAAPHVAGVAALLKSKYGEEATPAWIKQRLESTAMDKGAPGRDDEYGYGVLNAYAALGGA